MGPQRGAAGTAAAAVRVGAGAGAGLVRTLRISYCSCPSGAVSLRTLKGVALLWGARLDKPRGAGSCAGALRAQAGAHRAWGSRECGRVGQDGPTHSGAFFSQF